MFSSSLSSAPSTPRFRTFDSAQEPLILPQYEEHEEPPRSFLKRPSWISRGQAILLCALLTLFLGVWGILSVASSHMELLGLPVRLQASGVDVDSIREINATIIPPSDGVDVTRWTVAIPAGIKAPLRPTVYRGICNSVHEVSSMARFPGEHEHGAGHHGYYWIDDLFVDPADSDEPVEVEQGKQICDASLTYILESNDPGFGVALMGLWSAYGLAKKEGRAFFVNDRDWAWGSYSAFFVAPPTPKCAPPPPHWLLPCPHTTKHLVIAASTHTFAFGHAFADYFEDPRKMEVMRQVHIFDLVRQGYEGLFRLSLQPDDFSVVEARKHATPPPVVAVHIRRGDKHPLDWGFKKLGYVPLTRYAEITANLTAAADSAKATVLCASDNSAICYAPEFVGFELAQQQQQQHIRSRDDTKAPDEPGFSADAFRLMDMPQRALMGRSYLRDLKILGELAARDGSAVCDIASVTCRLLAVVMGWEKAVLGRGWVNVDGDFDWSGVDW